MILSAVVLLIAAVTRWLTGDDLVYWPWLTSALAPWLASVMTGSSVALVRLTVRRREFRPSSHLLLFRANDSPTGWKIHSQVDRLRQQIRDGRTVPEKLSRAQKAVLEKLGLGSVQANPKKVQDRMNREERERHRRKAEQEARDRRRIWAQARNKAG